MFNSLNIWEIATAFFCVGALASILISLTVIMRYFKGKIYNSVLILTCISLFYGLTVLLVIIKQEFQNDVEGSLIFFRFHEFALISLIYSLPLFLESFMAENKRLKPFLQKMTIFGGIIALGCFGAGLVFPEALTVVITGADVFPIQYIYGPVLLIEIFIGFLLMLFFPMTDFSSTDKIVYPASFFIAFTFGIADLIQMMTDFDITLVSGLENSTSLIGIVLFLTLLYMGIVKGFVRKARMEEEANIRAIKSQEELIYSSSHDQLSGLKNRNSFYLHLSKSIHQATMSDSGDNIALLVIDVDNLNHINSSFSHSIGDQVLRIVAERLQHYLRVTDQVFRIGGDEFAAVLHKIKEPSLAGLAADKLIRAFAEPVELDTNKGPKNIYVGISMGISCYPHDSEDPKELINHADMALYEAKKMRNSFRYYCNDMELAAEQRVNLTGIIRKALRQEMFQLYFQPLTDMQGKVKGAEALVRLNFDGKDIPPSLLIPVAESSGLILRLGEWVIEEAFRARNEMGHTVADDFFISINLSVKQLKDSNLVPFISHCLRRFDLDSSSFRFEITESSLMENFDAYNGVLAELKALGLRIVLDDFGTGYSSLGYLKNLPVDTVKIDKTFLVNFPEDKQNGAIIESIFNLANGLMMDVVVEGVENQEQKTHLSPYQYSHLQGFYFSEPLPLGSFMQYIRKIP